MVSKKHWKLQKWPPTNLKRVSHPRSGFTYRKYCFVDWVPVGGVIRIQYGHTNNCYYHISIVSLIARPQVQIVLITRPYKAYKTNNLFLSTYPCCNSYISYGNITMSVLSNSAVYPIWWLLVSSNLMLPDSWCYI